MSSERHEKLTELFLKVCEMEPGKRKTFLDEACQGDHALRAEVESMLAHDQASAEPLASATATTQMPSALQHPDSVGPYRIRTGRTTESSRSTHIYATHERVGLSR